MFSLFPLLQAPFPSSSIATNPSPTQGSGRTISKNACLVEKFVTEAGESLSRFTWLPPPVSKDGGGSKRAFRPLHSPWTCFLKAEFPGAPNLSQRQTGGLRATKGCDTSLTQGFLEQRVSRKTQRRNH